MKKFCVLPAALAVLLLSVATVSAHANLVRADPSPNSVLAVSPPSISLWFDEDLDSLFSTVSLLDSTQNAVDLGNVTFAADHKQMSVGVQPNLPPGAYSVSWRALSAADWHGTRGAFAIFVGAASAGQPVVLNTSSTEASVLPFPLEVAVRWLNLLAALALCGALTLNLLMGDADAEFAAMRAATARRMGLWVVVSLIVLFGGTIVSQLLQAAAASERGLADVIAQSIWLHTLTSTGFGQAALARIVLVDALLVLFAFGGDPERWRIRRLWNVRARDLAYVVMSALILLSFSLGSHAAAANDTLKLALIADWLHLLAIGAWTGGLFALTIVVWSMTGVEFSLTPGPSPAGRGENSTLLRILRRFSNVAVGGVVLFALTGLYAMWRQVGYANALVGTPYGQTLIIKNIMLVPLLLIGLINTLLLRPDVMTQLQVAGSKWQIVNHFVSRITHHASRFMPNPSLAVLHYVRIESLLGALVVLAAATLTALQPARTAVPPPLPPRFAMTRQTSEAKVALAVEPYVVGNQTFVVKVSDLQGNPLPNVTRVTLRFTFLGADLGTVTQEMQPVSVGAYKLEGGYLRVVGAWQVEAVVRRQDAADDVHVPYRLNVIDLANNRGDELPNLSSSLLFAIFDLLAGVALLIYARRKNVVEGKWIGIGALALGVVLFLMGTVFAPSASAGTLVNPLVPDESSLAQGKTIYEASCTVCHGPLGRGNGPLAASLNPRPSDFAIHVNQHTDEVLFNWVSKGMPGTAMSAWEDKLSETDRWNVLNYVQALGERALGATPTPAPTRAP